MHSYWEEEFQSPQHLILVRARPSWHPLCVERIGPGRSLRGGPPFRLLRLIDGYKVSEKLCLRGVYVNGPKALQIFGFRELLRVSPFPLL